MKKTMKLQGLVLAYELQRKSVKNINLRIRPEGIFVSAPHRAPQRVIDAFLQAQSAFILRALERLEEAGEGPSFADGSAFSLLGQEYLLCLQPGEKNRAQLQEGAVVLQLRDCADRALARKSLDRLCRHLAEETVPPLCGALCARMGRKLPEIRYRSMKSRWGSCTPAKNRICINTRLMSAPPDCVEYVIAHELCHFLQPNHSGQFYAELGRLLPDWKERKACLRPYGKYLG